MFGCTSYDFIAGGTGSGNVNRAYTVSLLDGLTNVGYAVDTELKSAYEKYLKAEKERIKKIKKEWFMPDIRPVEMTLDPAFIQKMVAKSDVALITIGRTSGEGTDRTASDFNLSNEEKQMLQAVTRAFHAAGKKVVVVLNIGGVIETASWKNMPDAILCAWQAGQEGGNSVADVLKGNASPSGKLTVTFPVNFADAASSSNFPVDLTGNVDIVNKNEKRYEVRNVDYTCYEEDIYVGYRYFDSFGKRVSYPFGYGLSYTTFEYGNPVIKNENAVYTVTVDVKNVGNLTWFQFFGLGECLQLFLRLVHRLAVWSGNIKLYNFLTCTIATVSLTVNAADLASYNEAASSWIVDAGVYKFLVGASSRDIKATLEAEVAASSVKTNDLLKLTKEMNILKR